MKWSPSFGQPEGWGPLQSNLSVTVGDGGVDLHWHAVNHANGYTVYRGDTPEALGDAPRQNNVKETRFNDGDIQTEATYYYAVTASNRWGESKLSPVVAAKSRSAVPGTPFQVTAIPGDRQVILSWREAAGAESYALYFSQAPNAGKESATRIYPVTSPYTHALLDNGTTYYYALAGVNSGGNVSPLSSEVAAQPQPPPLMAPTGLAATGGNARVTLTWNPVPGAEGYVLYWSLTPGVTPQDGERIAVGQSPFEHTGLSNGTAYHYTLTAWNAFEESEPSTEVSAIPEGGAYLPDLIVSSLEVRSFSETSIVYRYTITNIGEAPAWLNGPTEAQPDNVSVQAFVSADEIFANAGDIPAGGTILGLSPLGWLNPGESFTGQFSSSTTINLITHPFLTLKVDWGGVVDESNEDNNTLAVPIQAQAPSPLPPGNVSAEAGDGVVTVHWDAVTGATGYNLYWSTAPGVTKETGTLLTDVTSPFAHTGLENGTTYYYVVTTLATGVESTVSGEVHATPDAPICCGAWAPSPPMNTARYLLTSSVAVGKIYAFGGRSVHYLPDPNWSTVEEFDPSTGQWRYKTPMPTGRWGPTSAAVNGTIHVIGGFNGSYLGTVEAYDPATNAWSTRASMPTPREGAAISVVNNRIYVIGGINDTGYLHTVEIYDPAGNQWTTGAPVPTARYEAAAAVVNGRIHVIGGRGYLRTVEIYDPGSNTWTTGSPMPTGRTGLAGGVLNGRIHVMGGYFIDASGTHFTRNTEVYDPSTDTWSVAAPVAIGRYRPAVSAIDGTLYLIGGYDGSFYASVEAFSYPK